MLVEERSRAVAPATIGRSKVVRALASSAIVGESRLTIVASESPPGWSSSATDFPAAIARRAARTSSRIWPAEG
jgi:hypothetical protein